HRTKRQLRSSVAAARPIRCKWDYKQAPRGCGDAGCERRGTHKYSTRIMSDGAVYANENSKADHHVQSLPGRGVRHVDGFEKASGAIRRGGQDQEKGGL